MAHTHMLVVIMAYMKIPFLTIIIIFSVGLRTIVLGQLPTREYTPGKLFLSYEGNKDISDEQGNSKSEWTYYWPPYLFLDYERMYNRTTVDSSFAYRYSDFLSANNEPVLSNFYLEKEVIRLTWLRSFDSKIIIRLENNGSSVSIIEKQLNPIDQDQFKNDKGGWTRPKNYYNSADFTYKINSTSNYSRKLWDNLVDLVYESKLEELKTNNKLDGTDGADWIIEFHTRYGWFVSSRWAPTIKEYPKFRRIADFILDQSKFKKEERY